MDFSEALKGLKDGKHIKRQDKSWMFQEIFIMEWETENIIQILFKKRGEFYTWYPAYQDILAEDWIII